MTTTDPIILGLPGAARGVGGPKQSSRVLQPVFFQRRELDRILNIYGRMVAAGEWRDYAIDSSLEAAAFSIYRRASEMPIFRVEKRPKLARKQGAFSIIAATGQILKRGHELDQVLKYFDRKKFRVVED